MDGWDGERERCFSSFLLSLTTLSPDISPQQIDELARFVPRLIYVGRSAGGRAGGSGSDAAAAQPSPPPPPAAAGVVRATSLAGALGL